MSFIGSEGGHGLVMMGGLDSPLAMTCRELE